MSFPQKKFHLAVSTLAFCLFFLPVISNCRTALRPANFSGAEASIVLVVDEKLYQSDTATFDDVIRQLNRLPGVNAQYSESVEAPEKRFIIRIEENKNLPADGQSFSIEVSGNNCKIGGQAPSGYMNGLYYFLDQLGFRWYMPGDAWTIVPVGLRWPEMKSKIVTPDFRDRGYFGTGGWGGKKDYDPDNLIQQEFTDWDRRNRISATYRNQGHAGASFYQNNKRYLDQHPEYFCNNTPGPNAKIRLKDPAFISFIIAQKTKNVNGKNYETIAMDPHDGSGGPDDCLDSPTGMFNNFSDKYFWIANEVAKAVPAGSNALVDIYAYDKHARIPSFPLNPKVFPIIIPYAFQNVAPAEQFIRDWSGFQKGKPLGVYDYWNITQWSVGLPQFNIYSIPEKLKFWKEQNISSIYVESTWAKGPMGHAWWLFSRYAWNTAQNFDSLYNQFLQDCFGPGAEDIKRMYDRWSLSYQQNLEAGLSLQDISRARAKTGDKRILQRLDELSAYIVYMDKYYKYISSMNANDYQNLVQYIRQIHMLGMLQTYPLIQSYIPKPKAGNSALRPVNPRDAKQLMTSGVKDIQKVNYSISAYKMDIEKVTTCPAGNTLYPKYINGKNTYGFYLPVAQVVTFDLGTTTAPTDAILMDSEKRVLRKETIPVGEKGQSQTKFTVQLQKGKYFLQFGTFYQTSSVRFPGNLAFIGSTKAYDNYQYPVLYVYVPADVLEIVYFDQHGPGTNRKGYWLDAAGKRYDPAQIAPSTYQITVPQDQRGKVWQIVMGHSSWKLLNIPDVYSLNCFTVNE